MIKRFLLLFLLNTTPLMHAIPDGIIPGHIQVNWPLLMKEIRVNISIGIIGIAIGLPIARKAFGKLKLHLNQRFHLTTSKTDLARIEGALRLNAPLILQRHESDNKS